MQRQSNKIFEELSKELYRQEDEKKKEAYRAAGLDYPFMYWCNICSGRRRDCDCP